MNFLIVCQLYNFKEKKLIGMKKKYSTIKNTEYTKNLLTTQIKNIKTPVVPTNWERAFTNKGHAYFFNNQTRKTVWHPKDIPEGTMDIPEEETQV